MKNSKQFDVAEGVFKRHGRRRTRKRDWCRTQLSPREEKAYEERQKAEAKLLDAYRERGKAEAKRLRAEAKALRAKGEINEAMLKEVDAQKIASRGRVMYTRLKWRGPTKTPIERRVKQRRCVKERRKHDWVKHGWVCICNGPCVCERRVSDRRVLVRRSRKKPHVEDVHVPVFEALDWYEGRDKKEGSMIADSVFDKILS